MAIAKPETPLIPTFDQLTHQVANEKVFQNLVEIYSSCWEFDPQKRIDMVEIRVLLNKLLETENISTLNSPNSQS